MQNSNSKAGAEAPQSKNANVPTSSQNIAKPNVICSVSHVYGECRGWSCPICDKISQKVGDVSNPNVIIYGEKMCADCKIKIKELIGK